jgi:hypothetical protein
MHGQSKKMRELLGPSLPLKALCNADILLIVVPYYAEAQYLSDQISGLYISLKVVIILRCRTSLG